METLTSNEENSHRHSGESLKAELAAAVAILLGTGRHAEEAQQ